MFSQQFLILTFAPYQKQVDGIAKLLLARLARDLMLLELKMANVVVNKKGVNKDMNVKMEDANLFNHPLFYQGLSHQGTVHL
jgi:hypothetical protein